MIVPGDAVGCGPQIGARAVQRSTIIALAAETHEGNAEIAEQSARARMQN